MPRPGQLLAGSLASPYASLYQGKPLRPPASIQYQAYGNVRAFHRRLTSSPSLGLTILTNACSSSGYSDRNAILEWSERGAGSSLRFTKTPCGDIHSGQGCGAGIVSYRIVSYRIVSYRIVSYRIVSYRIVSYRIVSYRIVCPEYLRIR